MFKRAWQAWKELAHKIGNFQARVILTVFYGVLAPSGLGTRWFSHPLRIKRLPTQWLDHPDDAGDLELAKRQQHCVYPRGLLLFPRRGRGAVERWRLSGRRRRENASRASSMTTAFPAEPSSSVWIKKG